MIKITKATGKSFSELKRRQVERVIVNNRDKVQKLTELAALKTSGILTEEEFILIQDEILKNC